MTPRLGPYRLRPNNADAWLIASVVTAVFGLLLLVVLFR